jgi:2-polyprenyl-6-methoxyphenol hydroxylase-like FAD-dependent oxidoreductase
MKTADPKIDSKKVLISGASFAGLSTAYWMNKFGYNVTVVEVAEGLKKGGTPVNIQGHTIDIVKRMGLFDQIQANKLVMESMAFKNADDVTERLDFTQKRHEERGEVEYEIERDLLLDMMHAAVKADVTFLYGESITGLHESDDRMQVTFKKGSPQTFDLVFGCDGIHSAVRKYWFGPEAEFSKFLQTYFSITIVDKLLIPEYTTQMYSEPGKTVMLNAYNRKTDICLAFFAEQEIPYDYRNEQQQRSIIHDQFTGTGWRTAELLEEVQQSNTFYFDKLCQMKMPSWTKGRVALVGDAAYCPSPAAGRGGSVAIDGAAALADAFQKCNGDYALAFQEYNHSFRPFIEEVQAGVIDFGVEMLVPRSEEAIAKRNKEGFGFLVSLPIGHNISSHVVLKGQQNATS